MFTSTNQLSAQNIDVIKGEIHLLQQVGFNLTSGEILHITGVNGIGKTTLLRLLLGFGYCEQGTIEWNNAPLREQSEQYKQAVHYIGHKSGLKHGLTAYENLLYYCQIQGVEIEVAQLNMVIDKVGLALKQNVLLQLLSAGQKQRLTLARLLLIQRPLWILDEPFTALDNKGKALLNDLIKIHIQNNGMLIITTHHTQLDAGHSVSALHLEQA